MKIVKNYENFSQDYRLNENLLLNAWGAIANYFKRKFGKNAWLYYAAWLDKKGQLPKNKVELIFPDGYIERMEKGVKVPTDEDILADINAKFKTPVEEDPNIKSAQSDDLEEDEIEEDEIEEDETDLEDADSELKEGKLNEDFVSLKFPTAEGTGDELVRNVNVKELMERIERVYKMNALRASRHQKDKYDRESKFARKKTHALFIWGAPGIGKTEILHQVANKLDILVQEWHLATIEPTDFRGVPKVENVLGSDDPKDERTVSKLPAIFPTSDGNGKGGIMFFDELNRAPEMVLSASLALALSGKHGDYQLPPRWIVIAAGNRPGDISSVDLTDDIILWNRFAHVNYAPAIEDWVQWAMDKKHINPDLIAFLQFHKQFYHRYDPETKRANWPSARTWEMASEEEFFERDENWDNKLTYEQIKDIYTDAVGLDAAVDFVEYLKLKEFFNENDVKDVYEKGADAKKPPKRQDQARAAAASIAFWKKDDKLTVKDLENVLDFSLSLPDVESRTSLAVFLKMVHPYVKTDSPYKEIYNGFLKKWHAKLGEINP